MEVRRNSQEGELVFSGHDSERAGTVVQDRAEALALRAAPGGRRPGRQRARDARTGTPALRRRLGRRARARRELTRPRALLVVTGSELVRGERTDRNGPFLAREILERGLEPARITIVGDGERRARGGASGRARRGPPRHVGRPGPDPRRPDGRAARARHRARAAGGRRAPRARSRWFREASPSGCGAPTRTSSPAYGSRRRCRTAPSSVGLAGTAPGLVLEHRRDGRRRAARAAGRAAAALGLGGRVGADAGVACAGSSSGTTGAPALRRERVGRCTRAGGGRGRARGGGGDDLRARLRDPRRPRRRSRRRGERRTRSSRRSPGRSSAGSSPGTSGRSRSTCSRSAARAGSRSRRPSPAREVSWRSG